MQISDSTPAPPPSGAARPIRPSLAAQDDAALVHGRLGHWAARRPSQPALTLDAHGPSCRTLNFAQLHDLVEAHARQLRQHAAPATRLLDARQDPLAQLVDFLGTIRSGRCAAVADPAWPDALRARVADRLASGPAAPHGQRPAHTDASPGTDLAPEQHMPADPDDPFYIGFTSGSTGLPKGFRRSHRSWTESFRVSLTDLGVEAGDTVMAPGRLSHSLFLFGALLALWNGGGAWLQSRFSASATLRTLAGGAISTLICVPSQLLMMLSAARQRRQRPLSAPRLILISGARWPADQTPALQALFPTARILCFYGASETSYISWMPAHADAPPQAVGRPFSNLQLHIGPDPHQPAHPAGQPGLIWVRSPMLFSDYVNTDDQTAATRVGDWLSVRDVGHLDVDGILHLDGRENRMIVTRAHNLFPEEVETRLHAHPTIAHASLHGLADPQRGAVVHAVIGWQTSAAAPDQADLAARPGSRQLARWCEQQLERYKTPRHWWVWQGNWPCTASGKTDHATIRQALVRMLPGAPSHRVSLGVAPPTSPDTPPDATPLPPSGAPRQAQVLEPLEPLEPLAE